MVVGKRMEGEAHAEKKRKNKGRRWVLCIYITAPCFKVEISKLPMVSVLCPKICV